MTIKIDQKIISSTVVEKSAAEIPAAAADTSAEVIQMHENLARPESLQGVTYKIKTPLSEPLLANQQTAETIAKSHPLPRLGEPEEVASMAAYLLSAEAGWITGQIIGVDGGRSALAGH